MFFRICKLKVLVTSACVRFRTGGLAEADCLEFCFVVYGVLRRFTSIMIYMGIYFRYNIISKEYILLGRVYIETFRYMVQCGVLSSKMLETIKSEKKYFKGQHFKLLHI